MSDLSVKVTVQTAGESDAAPATTPVEQPPPQRSLLPRTRATCPDPGSLYDILRANSGTSLFVLPILWTDRHPDLLGAEFVALERPVVTPHSPTTGRARHDSKFSSPLVSSPRDRSSQPRPSKFAEALNCDLTSLLSVTDTRPSSKAGAIKRVLGSLFPLPFSRPRSAAELDLHFGDRLFRGAVRVPVMWKCVDSADSSFDSVATRPVSSFGHIASGACDTNEPTESLSAQSSQGLSTGPILAYVNRSHLAMIRQNLFRIAPGPEDGDRKNTPVSRLQGLRSKHLVPNEPDRDAYLMGIFLSMAQAHFYESSPTRMAPHMLWWHSRSRSDRTTTVPEFHDVKLRIITHDDETSDFIVYTTVVTADFLKRFAEPTKVTPDPDASGMSIEYVRVPVWPILGLKERLGHALGYDLVGDAQEPFNLFSDDGDKGEASEDATGGSAPDNASSGNADRKVEQNKASVQQTDGQHVGRTATLKRKRADEVSTRMLASSFEAKGKPGDGGGDRSSGSSNSKNNLNSSTGSTSSTSSTSGRANFKGNCNDTLSSTVTVTSPVSPRAKRRRTRSLSSSLAVF